MIKKTGLEQDILGCLDYDLRHSNHFSGVSGDSLNDMTVTFINDEGVRCKLKLHGEITEIDESDYIPPWEGSPEETDRFVALAKLYSAGDSSVMRADDPKLIAYGLIRELPDGKAEMACVKLSEFRKLGSRVNLSLWD